MPVPDSDPPVLPDEREVVPLVTEPPVEANA